MEKSKEQQGPHVDQPKMNMNCTVSPSPFAELIQEHRDIAFAKKQSNLLVFRKASDTVLHFLDKLDPDEQYRMKKLLVKIHEAIDQQK